MKAKQIRDMSNEEISQKINDSREELFNLRFQHATGQLENPMKVKAKKRDIARLKTILTEKENQGE